MASPFFVFENQIFISHLRLLPIHFAILGTYNHQTIDYTSLTLNGSKNGLF